MKTNKTIALCAIRINLEKAGYIGTAHLLINTKPQTSSAETVKQLKETPGIIIATRSLGKYEAYAVLAFRDAKDFYESVLEIKKFPDVLNVDVSIAMPGIKAFPPKTSQFLLHLNQDTKKE